MSAPLGPGRRPDRQNGLVAASYAWLRSVDLRECESLLEAMEEAQIACYTAVPARGADRRRDVYVDEGKTAQAMTVADVAHRRHTSRRITLDQNEVETRFADLVATLTGPSEPRDAPRLAGDPAEHAERAGAPEPVDVPERTDAPQPADPWGPADPRKPADSEEPADPDEDRGGAAAAPREGVDSWRGYAVEWSAEVDDDEGYEPPPPDPLPRPTSKVVGGILLLIAGCIALFSPAVLPIPLTVSTVLGVALIGGGVGYLLMQLRDRPQDPFDDGARV